MRPAFLLLLLPACAATPADLAAQEVPAATASELEVSPTLLDFDEVQVGEVAEELISVRNTGQGAGSVTLAVEGTLAVAFSLEPYSATIEPATHENFTLVFAPEGWGDHTVEVVVATTAGEEIDRVLVESRVVAD